MPSRKSRTLRRALAGAAAALLPLAVAPAVPAHATTDNPLLGRWGVYTGQRDDIHPAYAHARGKKRKLFAKVALRPRVTWFTNTAAPEDLERGIGEYIRNSQHGDPNTLVQLALFRQWPGGEFKRTTPLTPAQQAEYRRWMDAAAAAIGSTRTMVVLEPDLALDAPGAKKMPTADPGVRLSLVRYAAQRLAQLPNTTVYLEAGAPDWLSVPRAGQLLVDAGIGYTEGFALGGTHHTSVGADVNYAAKIVNWLAARGYPGKRVVLDTADNGRPFTFKQFNRKYKKAQFITPVICRTRREKRCDTLGVPPTTNVTAYRHKLHLTARQNQLLGALVDGFVWLGRPWRGNNGSTFSRKRLLQAARTTPFR